MNNIALTSDFPGGSKSRINKAGANVRNNNATNEDLHVIDEWRSAHSAVLNTFQAILRQRTKGLNIVVAQRHKRKSTIVGKLGRFPDMQLARMDDVAGFRLIFRSINELYEFRKNFHKARFLHQRRNDVDKYDYIKSPKSTGYRGIHDVYAYDVNSKNGRYLKGLLVEIQYRTLIQHSWATAVEVIGFITESQPKFQEGDKRYLNAMALASEILSKSFENSKGVFSNKSDLDVVKDFLELEQELNLLRTLEGLNAAKTEATSNRNAILIFTSTGDLEVRTFRGAKDALRALFALEKEMPGKDIVLVKADSNEDIRLAFKNYFSDAHDFISLVTEGCQLLSGKRLVADFPKNPLVYQ
ncbi:MAG: RelA/SpoT domain-containing protein [Methylococcaceae bacterium]